ncbi:MAG: Lrp/AsnC family transcriptional regulator [Gemella sp.]|nr:Lrp/AsnC family transcriptional regulator [Gemella sp.]
MELKSKILKLIESNSKITNSELAAMLDLDTNEVSKLIAEMEADKVICGYATLIDWDKTDNQNVSAMIELKITLQKGTGFDKIAEKVYSFPEVEAVYLMSGAYDLLVQIKHAPMKDIANFVSGSLSVIDEVQSTATHIILKKYKDYGIVFNKSETDKRQMVTP